MDMNGEYRISAPRSRVWEALNDPEILKQCIPGCEEIQKQSDTEMTAKVVAKVGPVKAKFAGKVTLSDIDAPNGYTITGEGSGGAAGFGKGGAKVNLVEDGADTVLSYTAHAQVGGKLAQIGSRLIDGTARKMADDFFAKFTQVVGQPAEPVAETERDIGIRRCGDWRSRRWPPRLRALAPLRRRHLQAMRPGLNRPCFSVPRRRPYRRHHPRLPRRQPVRRWLPPVRRASSKAVGCNPWFGYP